jgi:hypothetical protein
MAEQHTILGGKVYIYKRPSVDVPGQLYVGGTGAPSAALGPSITQIYDFISGANYGSAVESRLAPHN